MMPIKLPIIIAECGNNHEGNFDIALEMISRAKDSGADLCKFQAGHAEDFARKVEQISFYSKYDLEAINYNKLFEEGERIGIPVFFSIWSIDYEFLRKIEQWHKIPARQFSYGMIKKYDSETTFMSVPYMTPYLKNYNIKKSILLHCVSQYPAKNPHLDYITHMRYSLGTEVGYSDHTIGIDSCLKAYFEHKVIAIEKHFTLSHKFGELRDHIMSATPQELKKLVEKTKEKSSGIYGNGLKNKSV
jgi:sialic acid synthase SpsE